MQKLGVVEDTLFVPMLGRIYASEYCPQILYDKKALELKKKLPSDLIEKGICRTSILSWLCFPVCQYGSVYSVFSGTQTGRCDCPAGLWSGDNISPM